MRAVLSPDSRWRVVGVAVGLCLAVAVLAAGRVTAGAEGMGADLRIKASPIGELSVSTGEPFLTALDLRPGARSAGRLLVGNQTNVDLAVTARAERSSPDLDDQVHVRIAADGVVVVVDGTLGDVAEGVPLVLASGQQADVTFEAALVPGADRYQGRSVDVDLRLSVRPVGS